MTSDLSGQQASKILKFTPLRLAPTQPKPCAETIAAVEKLLAEAKQGTLTGVLVVGLCPDGHYMAHATGQAAKQPKRLAQPFNELMTVLNIEAAMTRQGGPKDRS